MQHLDRITVHRLAVPLAKPYRLAFGAVEAYDTIVAEATGRDGRRGLGEATVLTGYTDEEIEDCWNVARAIAGELPSLDAHAARARLHALAATHPFTATAFGTALEMIEGSPLFETAQPRSVPLVGLLDAGEAPAMETETERLLAEGYRTLKLKVGFDPASDAARVKMAQRAVRGRAGIRIDANQGYTAAQGVAFVRALDPAGIELFEQPCPAGDWDSHLEVAKAASVPLMLDESIYGMADIEQAASLKCAAYVKVKLMKLVTLDALARAIGRIRELGMKPVLGNGVACDLGCWLEGLVAARCIDNAGEMNGFLKARSPLLAAPLAFRDGALQLEAGYVPRLDAERLARNRIDSFTCTARGAVGAGAT
jgi:L-alanine-DL-glutamate epimerase-like enolase superfamily enzyme